MIDLVGHDERAIASAQLSERDHALRGQHGSGWISGRVDHDRPGARAEPPPDRVGPILEPVFLSHSDVDRPSVCVPDEVRIARVVRIAQHDLVARIQEVAEEELHRWGGAGRHQNLIGRDGYTVRRRVVFRDRFAERQDSETVRVARTAVLDRTLQGLTDHRGGFEVRLTELEVDHIDAGPLELLCPLGHFDRPDGLDLLDSPRKRHRCLPIRSRARTIFHSIPAPCRRTPTLPSGGSAQVTGTSTMRQPVARARTSSSTSRPKPRMASGSTRPPAAAAGNALKPYCESATPSRPTRA